MAQNQNLYIGGHSSQVLAWHSSRTAANSCAYLIPVIEPHMHILDIGCGPGSITLDLAALVPQGKVIGMDVGAEAIEEAKKIAKERKLSNVEFLVGDAHNLSFDAGVFDVVHAHQVLQHIGRPEHALKEWRRAVKPGGFIAARESDSESMTWYPESTDLAEFQHAYRKAMRARNGEPNGGRQVVAWARASGIDRAQINASASVWCYSSPQERQYWAQMWSNRCTEPMSRKRLIDGGHVSEDDLERFVNALRDWAENEDGWWTMQHGEILCHV